MGVMGAEADDHEAEYIRGVCEKEIVTGTENLLSLFAKPLVEVCMYPDKYMDTKLRTHASIALAKFMLVSEEFCEEQLQLLFTVLERSPEPVIRGNIIIATGDLSFRYFSKKYIFAVLYIMSKLLFHTTIDFPIHWNLGPHVCMLVFEMVRHWFAPTLLLF